MYRLIFIFTFFAILEPSFVQGQELLSQLEVEYKSAENSVVAQLNLAPNYAKALFLNNQKAQAYRIIESNLALAVEQSDGKYATILYAVQAINYRLDNKLAESVKSLNQANLYSLETKSDEALGYLQYAKGWIFSRNNQIAEAVSAYLQAIQHYEKSPTTSTLYGKFATAVKELAAIYSNLNEYQLEEKYSKQFLLLASKQSDPNLIFDAYMRMGYVCEQKYIENSSNIEWRTQAEKYYLWAITSFNRASQRMLNKSDLSYAAINLANLYMDFDADKAVEYAQMANKVSLEVGNAVHIASSFGILAEIALQNQDFSRAESHFLRAAEEMEKSAVKDDNIELAILESLSQVNESQGKDKQALVYYKRYIEKYQSVYDQEKLAITKRLESQFENERQEQKYIKLQLASEKKAQQIKLMQIVRAQREQVYNNLKLAEENQRERLKFSGLESEKKEQQLRLAKLESKQKNSDIENYKKLLAFKEKINRYYAVFIAIFTVLIVVLFYAYKQRAHSLKQREKLHAFALEKEKQNSKISTLTALLEGQEKERGRLARDLHDGLGGLLSGIKIQLSSVDRGLSASADHGLAQSISEVDEAVEELRRVAHNLMPDVLIKYGLEVALEEFAIRMSHSELQIHAELINYSNSLSKEKQLLVYRIVQELVNNVVKHARASEIIIQISEEGTLLNLVVEDNGSGFDLGALDVTKTAGFHNIESRVQFLKGVLHIQSEVNIGTSIELQIPID